MIPILIFSVACERFPDTVLMTGTVYDAWGGNGDPVAGATLTARGAALEVSDEVTSDDDGNFELQVPSSQVVFLVLDGEGFAPTAITGVSGADAFAAEDGALWMRTDAERDAIVEDFAGCSTADGAVVEGDVRFYLPVSDPMDTWPTVTTATVTAQYDDNSTVDACYLDDEGKSTPGADVTGTTGRFGIFGLSEGTITVRIEAGIDEGYTEDSVYLGWLPEGGVLPLYSALIFVE